MSGGLNRKLQNTVDLVDRRTRALKIPSFSEVKNPPTPADARGSAPGNKTPLPPTPADKRGMRATPAGQGGARKGKGVSA